MGNTHTQIETGFLMSIAGDCVVWDVVGNVSTLSTVNVGYNPTQYTLLDNDCLIVSLATSGDPTDTFASIGIGPISLPHGADWFIVGGNGTTTAVRQKRSIPEYDSWDFPAFTAPSYASAGLEVFYDINETTVSNVPALNPSNFTTKENGGVIFVHADASTDDLSCLAVIDDRLMFNYIGQTESRTGFLDHCKHEKARWYLNPMDVHIEHEGFLVNANGDCVSDTDQMTSIFDHAGISDLVDVTYELSMDAGCQMLTLVEDDPTTGGFHIDEDDNEWYMTRWNGLSTAGEYNGTTFTVLQSIHNNDVLFSKEAPMVYKLMYNSDTCLSTANNESLFVSSINDCFNNTAGQWVFVIEEEEEETTTEAGAGILDTISAVKLLLLICLSKALLSMTE